MRVGLRAVPGRLVCEDPAAVIAAIRDRMPAHAPVLIERREKLRLDAIRRLTEQERTDIGVVVEDAGDAPVVRLAVGDAAKQAAAILALAGVAAP